ncbi:MAG: hypothetical protein JWR20_2007 [Marmoricola sp.]|nr:hypothetical protein [Marmoricola sp.]
MTHMTAAGPRPAGALGQRRRRSRSSALALAGVLAGAMLLGACGGGAPRTAPSNASSPVGQPGQADGASSAVAADGTGGDDPAAQAVGLPDGATLKVTDSRPGTLPQEFISFVSPVLTLSPAGRLAAPVVVQLRLDNALPSGTPVFVARRDTAESPWSWSVGRLTSDLRHVEFTTSRLGQVGAVSIDLDPVVAATQDRVREAVTAPAPSETTTGEGAAARAASCTGGAALKKAGFTLDQTAGASVTGCLTLRNGRPALAVTNTLGFPVGLAHPGTPVVAGSTTSVPRTWMPWQGVLGAAASSAGVATVLAPGAGAAYVVDLAPSGSARLQTTAPPAAASLRVLRATVAALGERLSLFGTGKVDADETLATLVAAPTCSRAVAAAEATTMLSDCLSVDRLTQVLGDRAALLGPLLDSPELSSFLERQLAATLTRVRGSEQQRLVVRRAAPAFERLAGVWVGPGRTLTISPAGLVTEAVRTPDGRPLIDLTYQLTDPVAAPTGGSAAARLLSVRISDPALFSGRRPKAGDTGTLRLAGGVVTPPFVATTYCGRTARAGACS